MFRITVPARALSLAVTSAVLAAAGVACRDITSPAQDPTAVTYAPALNIRLSDFTRDTSGVYYRDVVPGSGTTAGKGSTVSYFYTGYLTDGRQFRTNTSLTAPEQLVIGAYGGIRGFDRGMVGMATGGRRIVIIPPALAYGNQAQGTLIPAGSILIYVFDTPAVTAAPTTTTKSRAAG